MNTIFDYIIVGSGFGGSIMSLRLVEKGYRVLLLERGKKWEFGEFPRRIDEIKKNLFWNPNQNQFGYMEVLNHESGNAMTLTASGLGGGSLIYANVLLEMKEKSFTDWPTPYRYSFLKPYYDKVINTMEASAYPAMDGYYSNTPKTLAFELLGKKYAQLQGQEFSAEYIRPPLAVNFKGDFPGEQIKNKHGALQSKCNKCGECDIGCNIQAKNTLDLNYLYKASDKALFKTPLEIITDAEVYDLNKLNQDVFEVFFKSHDGNIKSMKSKKVILSAGSLGSTEILLKLKCKNEFKMISDQLGKNWCGNGDLLSFALQSNKDLEPSHGPVITSGIRYNFKAYDSNKNSDIHDFCIEDAGYPVGFGWFVAGKLPSFSNIPYVFLFVWRQIIEFLYRFFGKEYGYSNNLGLEIANTIDDEKDLKSSLVLLGMGQDRSDGQIVLDKNKKARVIWNINNSKIHFSRMIQEMRRIAQFLNASFLLNPLTKMNKIIAVHPLGGCIMGENKNLGVVDTQGQVFGVPGLYVIDGSILPSATGANPALTIAAVAESIADKIPPLTN